MAMTTAVKNGVDVRKLGTLIEDVKREPWRARLTFTIQSEWKGGFRALHTTSDYVVGDEQGTRRTPHSLASDEPAQILGSDSGMSPTEVVLSALASCLSVGYAANAAGMGIDLDPSVSAVGTDGPARCV
jgi:organic hydroperoxide reductase OsmC/OhrA